LKHPTFVIASAERSNPSFVCGIVGRGSGSVSNCVVLSEEIRADGAFARCSLIAASYSSGDVTKSGNLALTDIDGNAGTTISGYGLLTVATNETATSLIVTATSTADPGKSGTANVTVNAQAVTQGKDNYSFINTATHFFSGYWVTYKISGDYYDYLLTARTPSSDTTSRKREATMQSRYGIRTVRPCRPIR
jgi:hypothetical protein